MILKRIALGGGCHWCTEAIFKSLLGVTKVEQGWVAPKSDTEPAFSEAVIVHYDESAISLATLIEIHLHTHSCCSNHALRRRYRSAVYTFGEAQKSAANTIIQHLQANFDQPIITKVLPFDAFRENIESLLDYYYKNPEKAFCQTYIDPKLRLLMQRFSRQLDTRRLAHLQQQNLHN